MAYIGLRKPIVFPKDTENEGKYLAGIPFGKAISFSDTPNIASASLYGDDTLAESEKAVTSSTLSLGTTDIPDNLKTPLFGHKNSTDEYAYNVDDVAAEVGFAVIGVKKVNGVRSFEVRAYPRTQWAEPTVDIQTRGESTEFTTPTTEGTALPDEKGDWKWEKSFESEEEITAWLQTKFPTNAVMAAAAMKAAVAKATK